MGAFLGGLTTSAEKQTGGKCSVFRVDHAAADFIRDPPGSKTLMAEMQIYSDCALCQSTTGLVPSPR